MNDMFQTPECNEVHVPESRQVLAFHPASQIFDLLAGRDFEELVNSIQKNGLRESIWLHPDGTILDGRNRYRACLAANVVPVFETWDGIGSAADFVWDLNFLRRHLDGGAKQMAAGRYAIELEREAKQRSGLRTDLAAGGQTSVQICTEVDFGRSREKAAERFGISPRTVASAVTVAKQGVPELAEKVEAHKVSVSAAADIATLPKTEQWEIVARGEKEILEKSKEIRAARADNTRTARIVKLAEISNNSRVGALGDMGRFPVLYADPPWRYDAIATVSREIENHYPTMSADELLALRVCDVSTDDAILYIWATAPKLTECCDLIEAWGFTYRTNLVWVKDKIGMGYHARSQHELLLVAKRGNIPPPAPSDRVSSVIYAERGDHSSKPECFYELIESFYPALPKLELFARSQRDGWSSWGNQAAT